MPPTYQPAQFPYTSSDPEREARVLARIALAEARLNSPEVTSLRTQPERDKLRGNIRRSIERTARELPSQNLTAKDACRHILMIINGFILEVQEGAEKVMEGLNLYPSGTLSGMDLAPLVRWARWHETWAMFQQDTVPLREGVEFADAWSDVAVLREHLRHLIDHERKAALGHLASGRHTSTQQLQAAVLHELDIARFDFAEMLELRAMPLVKRYARDVQTTRERQVAAQVATEMAKD